MKGDLFEGVTPEMIQRLDDYEGSAYTRQLAEVTLDDGRKLAAWLYCYSMPVADLELIPSGDWIDFISLPFPLE